MSETNTPENPTPESSDSKGRCSREGRSCRGGTRRRGRFLAFLLALGLGAVFLPRVWANEGWGGCHRSNFTEAEVREHIDRFGGHVLDELDATDAQRAALNKLADQAVPEMYALHKEAHALGREVADALFDVDRATLETLRQDGLELADRASTKGIDYAARAMEVLTPEQREELRQEFEKRHK